MPSLTVPLKIIQRFAMGRAAGLTVRRGADTKTIVAPTDGEPPIALYTAGTDVPEPITLSAFETITLRMGDEYLSALAVFPSTALRDAFVQQVSPDPPGADLALPVDLALPMIGRNIHEPHSHGGFIVRWLGPGRHALLRLPNPVLRRGWPQSSLRLQMTMTTHLEPAQAALAEFFVEDERLAFSLLQDGRAMRLFATLPAKFLGEETLALTLMAPAALCVFPEALKDSARALTFGLTSLSFHPVRQAEETVEDARDPPGAPMDPAEKLTRFANAHRPSRAEIVVGGERVIYEPPRRAEDGRLIAINTLAGRFFFPRIAMGPAEDDPVAYRASDLLTEEDIVGVLDPAAPDGDVPCEAILARLLPFFQATSPPGAAGSEA